MQFTKVLALAGVAAFAASGASAQTVGMGTSKVGWTAQAGAAIAKVVSTEGGMQMRRQSFGGSSVYVPQVGAGQLEFGLANELETHYAATGTGIYDGRKQPGLRVASVLVPFPVAIFSRKGSGIETVSDLKGKRVPSGWASQKIINVLMHGQLANAGLTYDDVVKVPTANVGGSADDFAAGNSDVFFFVATAGKVRETEASVSEGIQIVEIDDSPEAVKRMQEQVPPAYAMSVEPDTLTGANRPVHIMAFDYLLLTNETVSEDVVYEVLKTMYEHKQALVDAFPGMRRFGTDRMAKDIPATQYHDGAIKFLKEVGQWPPKSSS